MARSTGSAMPSVPTAHMVAVAGQDLNPAGGGTRATVSEAIKPRTATDSQREQWLSELRDIASVRGLEPFVLQEPMPTQAECAVQRPDLSGGELAAFAAYAASVGVRELKR